MIQTQNSSKARIKNDTVGDNGLKQLYQFFETQSSEEFRITCISIIEQSSGKRTTKDQFINELNNAKSKNTMLIKVNNYLMAGQGYGV